MGSQTLAETPRRPGDDVQGAYVAALQHALPSHGYRVGPPTGKLDPTTDAAIRAYQADAGMIENTQDAGALKATLDRLTYGHPPTPVTPAPATADSVAPAATGSPTSPSPAASQAEPEADPAAAAVTVPILNATGIRQIQDILKAKGYDLEPTGTLDIYTENAIKAFQLQNNLPADGHVDGNLLDLLKR
jgi:peptidoglycan hydrolase-like protein with peptidoglycan-binding domain